MSASNLLLRWSGLAALLGSMLYTLGDLFNLTHLGEPFAESIGSRLFVIQQTLHLLSAALLLLGLVGLYTTQSEAAGPVEWRVSTCPQTPTEWLGMEAAIAHCAAGASVWEWASNVPEGQEPDVVLGCAGDIPTLGTVAAAHWLRESAPELRIRVVNVVDRSRL